MSSGLVSVKIKIPTSLKLLLATNPARASAAMRPVLAKYGAMIERETKQKLSTGGYGPRRKAKRKGGRAYVRDYTPSKSGQPPRLKTGALRGSMGFSLKDYGAGRLSLIVGSVRSGSTRDAYTGKNQSFREGVKYSKYLEDKNRPYLTPTVERLRAGLTSEIKAALTAALKRR